jgi:hypothetical protein
MFMPASPSLIDDRNPRKSCAGLATSYYIRANPDKLYYAGATTIGII